MLSIILVTILSLFQSSTDTLELKGTQDIYYQVFTNKSTLCFKCKTNKNWSVPKVIDEHVSEYAMTVTFGDYVHIAWCKEGRVYYKTNIFPITKKDTIQWERFIIISPYFTEPSFNISIDTKGEWINVTWSAPAEDDPTIQEIWQRARWLEEPPDTWEDPECLSEPYSKSKIK